MTMEALTALDVEIAYLVGGEAALHADIEASSGTPASASSFGSRATHVTRRRRQCWTSAASTRRPSRSNRHAPRSVTASPSSHRGLEPGADYSVLIDPHPDGMEARTTGEVDAEGVLGVPGSVPDGERTGEYTVSVSPFEQDEVQASTEWVIAETCP